MKSNETIIFVGRSGSGKGTQVGLLKDYITRTHPEYELFHFGSGDYFRNFIQQSGYTSEIMRGILDSGKLAPDFITEWLLVDALVHNVKSENQIMVLDGFPRTIAQAHTLDSALDYYGRDSVHIIHIDVSEDEVRKRMSSRDRHDDKDSALENRMEWYRNNVLPMLDYFRNNSMQYFVHDINGEQTPEQVHQEILKTITL